jgi:hypothetical protein
LLAGGHPHMTVEREWLAAAAGQPWDLTRP